MSRMNKSKIKEGSETSAAVELNRDEWLADPSAVI